MKGLCFSQIAWELEDEDLIVPLLLEKGVQGVELAPTKYWKDLSKFDRGEAKVIKQQWRDRGLSIAGFQSLLFGHDHLKLFENEENTSLTMAYLQRVVDLAETLEAPVLVFGSPRNRQRKNMDFFSAFALAIDFFFELGEYASSRGTCVCIEANAKVYNCDFIVNSEEAEELVRAVDSQGFGLHLDLACMELENEDVPQRLKSCGHMVRHFHVSQPQLAPVSAQRLNHARGLIESTPELARSRETWLSIEMRSASSKEERIQNLSAALSNT